MRFEILSIASVALYTSFVCMDIQAQEYVVKAEDIKLDIVDEANYSHWPGTSPDEHTIYVQGEHSFLHHIYTDAVRAYDEGGFGSFVFFLSENPPEVSLTYIEPWTTSREGIRLKPGERIPDYIEYKGKLYNVVELTGSNYIANDVTLPNTVRYIEDGFVFAEGEINFGTGLETLGPNAIRESPYLKRLSFPNSLRRILSGAFNGGDAYRLGGVSYQMETIDFSPGITKICSDNFNNLPMVEEISLPCKLSYLGSNCFNNLTGLKRVYINPYVDYMENCFNDCPDIEEIIIDKWHNDMRLVNCFNAVDKSKCVVKVKYNPGSYIQEVGNINYPDKEHYWNGFKIVMTEQSGVDNVMSGVTTSVDGVRLYDITGRPVESVDKLNRGEVYIECNGNASDKKITN